LVSNCGLCPEARGRKWQDLVTGQNGGDPVSHQYGMPRYGRVAPVVPKEPIAAIGSFGNTGATLPYRGIPYWWETGSPPFCPVTRSCHFRPRASGQRPQLET